MLVSVPSNASYRSSPLGKVLRIDVDDRDPGKEYAVPPTNPYIGEEGALPEMYAMGLRNPWRAELDVFILEMNVNYVI